MIGALVKWCADRKAVALAEAYRRGYDYAAGELLRGESCVAYFESVTDGSFSQDDWGKEYDRGIRDACARLVHSGVVPDDETYGQPPIGLRPPQFVESPVNIGKRTHEIVEAMNRYACVDAVIPILWVEELSNLVEMRASGATEARPAA